MKSHQTLNPLLQLGPWQNLSRSNLRKVLHLLTMGSLINQRHDLSVFMDDTNLKPLKKGPDDEPESNTISTSSPMAGDVMPQRVGTLPNYGCSFKCDVRAEKRRGSSTLNLRRRSMQRKLKGLIGKPNPRKHKKQRSSC